MNAIPKRVDLLQSARRTWVTYRLRRYLVNWREVADAYWNSAPMPPLRLRSGIVLHSTAYDSPVTLLFEIVSDGSYHYFRNVDLAGTIVDIGANIGCTSLDFALLYPRARIHAYEPNPATFETLRLNLEANKVGARVTAFSEAVGSSCGMLPLWTGMPSRSVSSYFTTSPHPDAQRVDVPIIDLATCLARVKTPTISLLKIDAEGAEVEMLESAPAGVLQKAERIALEYHLMFHPDADQQCLRALESAGFKCHRTTPDAGLGMIYAWR